MGRLGPQGLARVARNYLRKKKRTVNIKMVLDCQVQLQAFKSCYNRLEII